MHQYLLTMRILMLLSLCSCSLPMYGTDYTYQEVHVATVDAGSRADAPVATADSGPATLPQLQQSPDAGQVINIGLNVLPDVEPDSGPTIVLATYDAGGIVVQSCTQQSGSCIGTTGHTVIVCTVPDPSTYPRNCLSMGGLSFCCPCQIDPVDYTQCN